MRSIVAETVSLRPDLGEESLDSGHDWVLILAGGEGSRLRTLTTSQQGVTIPKQFCSLRGGVSLLDETVRRAQSLVPPNRICASIATHHRQWWEEPLKMLPASNLQIQPMNRGTGIGILLPLLHILYRDPAARIVTLPCDHYIEDESVLAQTIRHALTHAHSRSDALLMLGVEPELPDPELGYIVPRPIVGSELQAVARFVEKPPVLLAQELIDHGALWNAFISVGTAQGMLRMFQSRYMRAIRSLRILVEANLRGVIDARETAAIYEELPQIDFSRDVIHGQEAQLRVIKVPRCGWSDLGTPRSVADTLRRLRISDVPPGNLRDPARCFRIKSLWVD